MSVNMNEKTENVSRKTNQKQTKIIQKNTCL